MVIIDTIAFETYKVKDFIKSIFINELRKIYEWLK